MTVKTPAGRLASSFGNVEALEALYAPEVEWKISASLGVPHLRGIEAVLAFNRQVWSEHHRGSDCSVVLLDELGDETASAVRFTYRAWSLFAQDWYENEYTLFVRAGPMGILSVVEAFDTAATIDFLAGRPFGSGWASIEGEVGDRVETLGRPEPTA